MSFVACLLAAAPVSATLHQPTALGLSADGEWLFVATSAAERDARGWVSVWDLSKPELTATIPGVPRGVTAIQPSADGKRFVIVCGNEWHVDHIEVWDTDARKRRHAFELATHTGGQFALSPDGNWVAVRTRKDRVDRPATAVWNTETGERAAKVEKAIAELAGAVAFTPDSKRLAVVSGSTYAEFEIASGEKGASWALKEPPGQAFRETDSGPGPRSSRAAEGR